MLTLTNPNSLKEVLKKTNLRHIAIIMDGNRRWATEHSLPQSAGHLKGKEAFKKTVRASAEAGLEFLTVYAFSTENWKRSDSEIKFLMDVFKQAIADEIDEFCKANIKLSILGDTSAFSTEVQAMIDSSCAKTKDNTGLSLQVALNYGSRAEIVRSVKKIAQKVKNKELLVDEITEKSLEENFYNSSMPDPDLLIRTGGEMRLSNYLLWQCAYSEIYITPKMWPDFDGNTLLEAAKDFENRNRRYGK